MTATNGKRQSLSKSNIFLNYLFVAKHNVIIQPSLTSQLPAAPPGQQPRKPTQMKTFFTMMFATMMLAATSATASEYCDATPPAQAYSFTKYFDNQGVSYTERAVIDHPCSDVGRYTRNYSRLYQYQMSAQVLTALEDECSIEGRGNGSNQWVRNSNCRVGDVIEIESGY